MNKLAMDIIQYRKALAAFSIVVFVFLAIADGLLVYEERGLLFESFQKHARNEFDLVGAVTREALARQDYATVENYLVDWSQERADVVELTATADNGFILSHYQRPSPSIRTIRLQHRVHYADDKILTLELIRDLSPVMKQLHMLAFRLITGSILLTILLALVAWITIRHTALKPLETEIRKRQRAESELINHRDRLDEMVTDRTRELTLANKSLEQEITERQHAEEMLRSLHKYNHLLLESAGEGICGLDQHGKCTFVNQAALNMLGFQRDEIVGLDFHTLIHNSHPDGSLYPKDSCPTNIALQEGKSSMTEGEVFWRKDGTKFPVEFSSHPIVENRLITGAVIVFRDVTAARALSEKLTYQATHDALTGLVNRLEFEQRLNRVLKSAKEELNEHVLLYMDLDQFKVINDTCGHAAGDELLRQIADLLQNRIRTRDTLARLGGDEFGVLLEHCTLENAKHVAEDTLNAFQEFRFSWDGRIFSVGVSIGVVSTNDLSTNLTGALAAADTACYAAKESGRNRVHVYQAEDIELSRRQGEMGWVSRIQSALAEERLVLYVQAIVPGNPATQCCQFCEVLLRIRDENDSRLISPGEFLPAAERFDLMPAIDRWVVREVLQHLKALPRHIQTSTTWTVNLSGASISDDNFLSFVGEEYRRAQLPPSVLHFEITETAAVTNLSKAAHFIQELKNLGCGFALDDFGSGMSSFAYLKNLPVDFVKIDGAFVRDILNDNLDLAMVKSINEIAQLMGMRTIAEFVENEGIAEKLREVGVDYLQGYGIEAPIPLDEWKQRCIQQTMLKTGTV